MPSSWNFWYSYPISCQILKVRYLLCSSKKNGLILPWDMYCGTASVFNILSFWQLCGTRTEPWNPCGICGRKYVCLQISQYWPVADLSFCSLILCFYSEMFVYLSFWFCDIVFLKVNIWLFVVVSPTPIEGEIEKVEYLYANGQKVSLYRFTWFPKDIASGCPVERCPFLWKASKDDIISFGRIARIPPCVFWGVAAFVTRMRPACRMPTRCPFLVRGWAGNCAQGTRRCAGFHLRCIFRSFGSGWTMT